MRVHLLLACALAIGPSVARADIDARGAYTTSIGVQVPPFFGNEPTISLRYSSRGGPDLAGFGWSVAVGSTIRRVSAGGGSPRFDATDRFEVDGAELLPCSGAAGFASCVAGGDFAFAAETYERVRLDQSTNAWRINEPSGKTRTYTAVLAGSGGFATTTTWMLVSVEDRLGNRVAYTNTCDGTLACYPTAIRYGDGRSCGMHPDIPIGNVVAGANITLHWELRPDPIESGNAGRRFAVRKRLASIDVQHGLSRLRTYELRYATTSAGNRSLLDRVDEFGEDAVLGPTGRVLVGTRAPARMFTANASVASTLSNPSSVPGTAIDLTTAGPAAMGRTWRGEEVTPGNLLVADVDGDRRPDAITWETMDPTQCKQIRVSVRTASGQRDDRKLDLPFLIDPDRCSFRAHAVELDGDGRADLLFVRDRYLGDPKDSIATREVWSVLRTADGWRPARDMFPTEVRFVPSESSIPCSVGDIDGNGLSDFVCVSYPVQGGHELVAATSVGGGLFQAAHLASPMFMPLNFMQLIDLDGDQRDDFVFLEHHPDPHGGCVPDPADAAHCFHWALRTGISRGTDNPVWSLQDMTALWSTLGELFTPTQFLSGDFDGDGRRDVVIVTKYALARIVVLHNRSRGEIRWNAAAPQYVPHLSGTFSIGDHDGDGADDLFVATPHSPHAPTGCSADQPSSHGHLIVGRSLRDGTFALSDPTTTCIGEDGVPVVFSDDLGLGAFSVDVNGDLRSDWLFTTGKSGYFIDERVAPHGAPPPGALRPADIDGDGRQDWVAVNFMNPGIEVFTARTQPDGSVFQRRSLFSPISGEHTAPHRARDSFVVDVGSVGGGPDGRDDIVIVDGEARMLTTLLAKGDGSYARRLYDMGTSVTTPVQIWKTLDLDGDGDQDLVHLEHTTFAGVPQVRTTVYLALPDGAWSKAISRFHYGNLVANPQVSRFMQVDVDGDSRMDLVDIAFDHTSTDGNNTQLRILRSRGNGEFDALSHRLSQHRVDAIRYQPGDFDGDGRTDFAVAPAEEVASVLYSRGDGTYVQGDMQLTGLDAALEGWGEVWFADLDRDGRDDLVHVTLAATGGPLIGMSIGWNRGTAFVPEHISSLPSPTRERPRLMLVDIDADGDRDLVHAGPSLVRWTLNTARAQIVTDANELGGRTEIQYATSAGKHTVMPPGAPVIVATELRMFDGRSSLPVETQTFTHEGATYDFAAHAFLGFRWRSVQRPRGTTKDSFALDARCGARPEASELLTSAGARLNVVDRSFPLPGGPATPTYCAATSEEHLECEGAATPTQCRRSGVVYAHDIFGNVVRVLDRGLSSTPSDDRMTESQFFPNLVDYVVELPATTTRSQAVQTQSGWGWSVLRDQRFRYDTNPTHLMPPQRRGQIAERGDWDDVQGRYLSTRFAYDGMRLESMNGPPTPHAPDGEVTSWLYDCTYQRVPVVECDALHCEVGAWDLDHLRKTAAFDVNAIPTTYSYDKLGRLAETRGANGSMTRTRYAEQATWGTPDQRTIVEVADGSPDGVFATTSFFDGLARVYSTLVEGSRTVDYQYDGASGRVAAESVPHLGGPATAFTHTTFDAANRVVRVQLPDNRYRTTTYGIGTLTEVDERGAKKISRIDGHGRVFEVEEVVRTCMAEDPETQCLSQSYVTTYVHDGADQLLSIIDALGHWTISTYDTLGRRRTHTSPDGGHEVITYYDDGRAETATDVAGTVRQMFYDVLGRPLLETITDANANIARIVEHAWDYDPQTGDARGASIGRETRVSDWSDVLVTSDSTYANTGQPSLTRSCVDGNCAEVGFDYDVAGRLATVTYPDNSGVISGSSEVVAYEYRDDGNLGRIPGYVDDVTYDAFGAPAKIPFANGVIEIRNRNPLRGWINTVDVIGPTGTLVDLAITHRDPNGGINRLVVSGTTYSAEEIYRRDDLGRMTHSDSSVSGQRDFDYDPIGRMTYDTSRGEIFYDDARHVHAMTSTRAGQAYEYDDRGQLVADGNRLFSWTLEGKLARVFDQQSGETSEMRYTLDGKRVSVGTSRGTKYTFDSFVELEPRDGYITHVQAFGRTIARTDPGGRREYLHVDHLGSVRAVTDEHGELVEETDYDVWGSPRHVDGSARTTHGFVGAESEEASDLVFLGARYYDPQLPQFLSPDTILPDPYTPQTLNTYAFAMNDPATLIDPTGHSPENPEDDWLPYPEPPDPDPAPEPVAPKTPLSPEEWLKQQDKYAGLSPEQREGHEFWDWNERVGRRVVPVIAAGIRVAGFWDPTPITTWAADLVDETTGVDSNEYLGGETVVTVVGFIVPTKAVLKKLFTARKFDGVLKVVVSTSSTSHYERRLVQRKYARANRFIREGTFDAIAGTRVPYNRYASQQYVQLVYDIPGGASKIRILKTTGGRAVDESLGRYWGGQALPFNQDLIRSNLNSALGAAEWRAVINQSVRPGDRVEKFLIQWENR